MTTSENAKNTVSIFITIAVVIAIIAIVAVLIGANATKNGTASPFAITHTQASISRTGDDGAEITFHYKNSKGKNDNYKVIMTALKNTGSNLTEDKSRIYENVTDTIFNNFGTIQSADIGFQDGSSLSIIGNAEKEKGKPKKDGKVYLSSIYKEGKTFSDPDTDFE